jgi:UDP-N-acetylmuramoyl-L-alanyl-D-glutamate--2,6-diaminopimelate ligase
VAIKGLSADSRKVEKGYLFAALPGSQTDGAKFMQAAIENGAAAVLLPVGSADVADVPVPVIEDADPRRALALMAARFYKRQPKTAAAVTGTNGKTSVVSFLQQIWQAMGLDAASLGTVGLNSAHGSVSLAHTTPDPVVLHALLAEAAKQGVSHVAVEASSHGLQQHRLDGLKLKAAAFTNISRDHLDYHGNFKDYLAQKRRLFDELLPENGAAIVNADALHADVFCAAAQTRGARLITVGEEGEDLALRGAVIDGFGQQLSIGAGGKTFDIALPLVGAFQTSNALVAAGLAIGCGGAAGDVLPLLGQLKGAHGRLDLCGTASSGAPIFIDYAHTPDALAHALDALRPYVRSRLIVAFGCGGDRDTGKRPLMGAVAGDRADLVIVTDDNPRGEAPEVIRAQIMKSVPEAREIGDRAEAIAAAIEAAQEGDLVLIAGKGHETGQIVGDRVIPFSDHEAVAAALGAELADV